MSNPALRHDVEFDNAMLFGHYVLVVAGGHIAGGGLVDGYDDRHVWINGKPYARTQTSFERMPAPDIDIPS